MGRLEANQKLQKKYKPKPLKEIAVVSIAPVSIKKELSVHKQWQ